MINTLMLRGKIAECGYSQKTLAHKMNMSENTFSEKVRGITAFDTDQVAKLCSLLNIEDCNTKVQIFLC